MNYSKAKAIPRQAAELNSAPSADRGMGEEKSTGEKIVELLCSGMTAKQIETELGISHHTLEERLRPVRVGAGLPYAKREYKARKNDILANVAKWDKHRKRMQELEQQFRASLVQFDS